MGKLNFFTQLIVLLADGGGGMDGDLIGKARKGNKEALVKLIINRQDEFYRLSYSYMKNEDDAMNMVQDMVVKLYENIHRLKKLDSFYTYAKTILVNLCKDELKRKKRVLLVDAFPEERSEDENTLLVEDLLSKLDVKHRDVIRLRYILSYDYLEIARVLKIPLGTAKSRAHYGLKKLKEEYNAGR